jgi:thioredoxin-dependent peroxiredoxin
MLKIQTKAPNFELKDQREELRSLASYLGRWVVLYFYPKDDTPGCAKEACMIAEVYEQFADLGVVVLGVSKDSPASHVKFAEKYKLPFTLLSDPTGEMIESYEALAKKSIFGKKFQGVKRVTYIINPEGIIVKSYDKVSPADHALQLLADLRIVMK